MKLRKLVLCVCMVWILLGFTCLASMNISESFSYSNVTNRKLIGQIRNDSSENITFLINGRPTSGQSGVNVILIEIESGEEMQYHFPFYTNIPDWEVTLPAKKKWNLYVESANLSTPVSGMVVVRTK